MLTSSDYMQIMVSLDDLKRRNEEEVQEYKECEAEGRNLKSIIDIKIKNIEELETLISKIDAHLFPNLRKEVEI